MRRFLVVALLGFLPSCGWIREQAKEQVEILGNDLREETKKRLAEEASARAPEQAKAADTNHDGTTTWDEWIASLQGGGAAAVIALLIALIKGIKNQKQAVEVAHARIDKTKSEVDELWDKTHKPAPSGFVLQE